MVQAWPLAWLMRIGSIKKLPMWTFLQSLTCWFFTRGKATAFLQYERGMRHYSHHSKIKSYLEVRAAAPCKPLYAGSICVVTSSSLACPYSGASQPNEGAAR